MKITAKKFCSLSRRDFDNGAVHDEIYATLKEHEKLVELVREYRRLVDACGITGVPTDTIETIEAEIDVIVGKGE